MDSKFSDILKIVHMRQLEMSLFFFFNTLEKKNIVNSNERVLLIKGCFPLFACKGSESLSAV